MSDPKPGNEFAMQLQALLQPTDKSSLTAQQVIENPETAAMLSKVIRPPANSPIANQPTDQMLEFISGDALEVSRRTMSRVEDNENIFKLFPDIAFCAQTLTAATLSPKDMLKTDVNFKLKDTPWSAKIDSLLVDIFRAELTNRYGLVEDAYTIVYDALFRAGSYPVLVLPEAAVDYVINGATTPTGEKKMAAESLVDAGIFRDKEMTQTRSLGILGDPHKDDTRNVRAAETFHFHQVSAGDYNEKLWIDPSINEIKSDVFEIKKIAEMAAECISVTDNFDYLKLPDVQEAHKQIEQSSAISKHRQFSVRAFESAHMEMKAEEGKRFTADELKSALYKSNHAAYKPTLSVPGSRSLRRRSVGRPLVSPIPPEAVIPIYVPGNRRRHIAYLIAVDVDGNAISYDSKLSNFGQGLSNFTDNDNMSSSASGLLTERARKNLISDNYVPVIDRISEIQAEMIERDVMERFSRGLVQKNVEIGTNDDLNRIMLARSLAGRQTKLVYVPAEYMTYFAFDYHRNGVGKSYLDDLSNIIGMRAMVMFSSIWAKVRSSISTITTKIHFDPKEPDPVKVIEMTKHLVARSRQQFFTNGLRRVTDFTDWIQRAGIQITWDGHPKLPSTNFEFETKNLDHVQPDDTLDDQLSDLCYLHFGLSPETVNKGKALFATTIQNDSILFAKRTMMLGRKFSKDMTDHGRRIASHDTEIQKQIVEVMQSNTEEFLEALDEEDRNRFNTGERGDQIAITQKILEQVIGCLEISVPEPDSTSIVNLTKELQEYSQLVDEVMKSIASSEAIPAEMVGESSQMIESVAKSYKAELMRQFIATNNIVPEAFEILTTDEKGLPDGKVNDNMAKHINAMTSLVLDAISRTKAMKEAADKDRTTLGVSGGFGGSGDFGSEGSSFSEGGSGGADEFGLGGGDFNEPLPGEGEEQPTNQPADQPVEEEPPEQPEV